MKRIQLLGIILSFSFLFACKKDSNDAGSDGTRLSKVIVWTSTRPATIVEVYGYRYDGMNRVTEISYAQGDSASGEDQAKPYESTKWFYNGNDKLPYKRTGMQSILHYDEYYSYDNQGRLVADSTVTANCDCYIVYKYNWSGNTVMRTLISGNFSGSVLSTSQDSIAITSKYQTGVFHSNTQTGELTGAFFTYDNNINPLHSLNIGGASPFSGLGGIPSQGFSENNIIETAYGYYDIYGPGPVTFVKSQILSYKYNYNAGGLPVDCEHSGNTPAPSKIKFYYN